MAKPTQDSPEREQEFTWLAISRKYVKPGKSHDMDAIRDSIARRWAAETHAHP